MASKVKEAAGSVERLLLPTLNSIQGDIKSINTKIDEKDRRDQIQFDSVRSDITSLKNELRTEISAVRTEVKGISDKIDLVREVEKLKIEVAELKRRR
jgi:hypothetical protein